MRLHPANPAEAGQPDEMPPIADPELPVTDDEELPPEKRPLP